MTLEQYCIRRTVIKTKNNNYHRYVLSLTYSLKYVALLFQMATEEDYTLIYSSKRGGKIIIRYNQYYQRVPTRFNIPNI